MDYKQQHDAFYAFINMLSEFGIFESDMTILKRVITPSAPIVYWSMELYDKDENEIKGGGGLGVLAADTRREAEALGVPFVIVTPFYPKESHQELNDFWQSERLDSVKPSRNFKKREDTAIRTVVHSEVPLNVFTTTHGSTEIITITEPNFGELYADTSGSYHRLYQEVALGLGGYYALKARGYKPAFMHMNEAPTVFAALAYLDDLCSSGIIFDQAFETVRDMILYTNHTLVQAVEGEFSRQQFDHMVMPNIRSQEIKDWLYGMFNEWGMIKLSSLAIELAATKSGVSQLHARVANFHDRHGNKVHFDAVTNGISRKWILPEITEYYRELGILNADNLPTADYKDNLQKLDIHRVRELKRQGRAFMHSELALRKDQYGNVVRIPDDAIIFDFKRRFAGYKRPEMVFSDPERLAYILQNYNAHFLVTGKPHPGDDTMKHELQDILYQVQNHPVLKERIHYIQDYDEDVGQALAIGADCAINVPVVGEEACGTSWMKDIANLKLLISTPDGGVADSTPIACLEVTGPDEAASLYENLEIAAQMLRDDERYRRELIRELEAYIPVISGSRMIAQYLKLFLRMEKLKPTPTYLPEPTHHKIDIN